ncbi:hypothetical protein B0T22DRAFT_310850 [Podospora appendiculata]|uniref:Uncharacterized protein n=1 Tax=Podospora appendiculata TaxID=314037 RepID=A0AAE0WZ81_9PEZI|nr:hypothetical protein B0T22DRAFT_310850 [Podospora appendiculata]
MLPIPREPSSQRLPYPPSPPALPLHKPNPVSLRAPPRLWHQRAAAAKWPIYYTTSESCFALPLPPPPQVSVPTTAGTRSVSATHTPVTAFVLESGGGAAALLLLQVVRPGKARDVSVWWCALSVLCVWGGLAYRSELPIAKHSPTHITALQTAPAFFLVIPARVSLNPGSWLWLSVVLVPGLRTPLMAGGVDGLALVDCGILPVELANLC